MRRWSRYRLILVLAAAALVAALIIVAACSTTPDPKTKPSSSATQASGSTPGGDPATSIQLVAKKMAFDTKKITVVAGAKVTMVFDNQDPGVPHNFAAYESADAKVPIFIGEIILGPKTITYEFTAPSKPGNYFFRCDAHPTTMTGTLVVQ